MIEKLKISGTMIARITRHEDLIVFYEKLSLNYDAEFYLKQFSGKLQVEYLKHYYKRTPWQVFSLNFLQKQVF